MDDAPTIPELRSITANMNSKGRSLTLFLVSSGSRIGETLKLEADPPRVFMHVIDFCISPGDLYI